MKLFSLLFCGGTQQPSNQYKLRVQSLDNSARLSQSVSMIIQGGFKQRVKQYQKAYPDQVLRYKKKQQMCHVIKDLDHIKQNIKKSLRVMDNKGYLRQICCSLWPKYMNDRLFSIENSFSEDWKKLILREIDELEAVFGFYIESVYKNIVQNPNFHIHLSMAFRDVLDRITGSEKWLPINIRIQNLYRLSEYRIQNSMMIEKTPPEQQFRYQIQMLKKIYIEPHLSKKIQYITQLKPMITAYSRPKVIFSVCQYCLFKAGLAGYHEMLEFLEQVYPPGEQIEEFYKLLKAASIRTVLKFQEQQPFNYEYITFDLSHTSAFVLTNLNYIISSQNNWNSLVSLTYLKPTMCINIKLVDFKYNHFRIGMIGSHERNGGETEEDSKQLRDLSKINESIVLCLMSSSVIKKGERIRVPRINASVKEIQLNILENGIEWRYQNQKFTVPVEFEGPIRLHVVMKKGKFQQSPLRRF